MTFDLQSALCTGLTTLAFVAGLAAFISACQSAVACAPPAEANRVVWISATVFATIVMIVSIAVAKGFA